MSGPWVALEHHEDFSKQFVTVQWTYFNVCNFSCSYCIPDLNSGSNKGVHFVHALKFLNRLLKGNPQKKFFFEFTGGEITHHPEFVSLMSFIKSNGGHTGILSNGSKPLQWWKDNVHLLDSVSLSFHSEEGKEENFFEVANFLKGHVNLSVNVIMKPENFNHLYQFAERIAAAGMGVNIQALFKNFKGPMFSYSPEEMKLLQSPSLPVRSDEKRKSQSYRSLMSYVSSDGTRETANPSELIAQGKNSWTGWTCMAGVENLSIDVNGHVYRGLCREGREIGSVFDENFVLPSEGIVCTKALCACGFDIMCSKYQKKSV